MQETMPMGSLEDHGRRRPAGISAIEEDFFFSGDSLVLLYIGMSKVDASGTQAIKVKFGVCSIPVCCLSGNALFYW